MPRVNTYELAGICFGLLRVVRISYLKGSGGETKWLCRCECGAEKAVATRSLLEGATRSCGAKECRRKQNELKVLSQ